MKLNILQKDYLKCIMKGNRKKSSELVLNYFNENKDLIKLYECLFKTTLYHIGVLWESNEISVAIEHMATAITQEIMNNIFSDIISHDRANKKVLVGCVENELHQVGAKMVADVFEKNGWDAYFLGANTPTNELIDFISLNPVDLIALSITVYFHFDELTQMIKKIREHYPKLHVIIGGQAFKYGNPLKIKDEKITIIDNLNTLETFIKSLNLKGVYNG